MLGILDPSAGTVAKGLLRFAAVYRVGPKNLLRDLSVVETLVKEVLGCD